MNDDEIGSERRGTTTHPQRLTTDRTMNDQNDNVVCGIEREKAISR